MKEGQNTIFIDSFMLGYNDIVAGSVSEKRFLESDYLKSGVYANKISSIIDLVIIKDDKITFVSVPSEVQVSVWPFVLKQENTGKKYYLYYYQRADGKMDYKALSEEEYYYKLEISNENNKKLIK